MPFTTSSQKYSVHSTSSLSRLLSKSLSQPRSRVVPLLPLQADRPEES